MNTTYINRYAAFLKRAVQLTRPLKVVFDFSNGPTKLVVPRVFRGNPLITPIYEDRKVSGGFPAHGPDPLVRKAQQHLSREVQRHRADLGVIFDADGDRAFFVDEKGTLLFSYLIAYLLSLREEGPIVADVPTHISLLKTELLPHSRLFMSKVGSYFIKKEMRRRNAALGVEYSGHYYFKDFFFSDSGVLTAIKVINSVSRLPYSLHAFYSLLPQIFEKQMNIRVRGGDMRKELSRFKKRYAHRAKHMERIDGFVFDFGDSWLTVRSSNTEPLLRLTAGARNEKRLRGLLRNLI